MHRPAKVTLTITLDDKGGVEVNGPIDQTLFCYGLLEVAKDTIRRHGEEQARRVQPPAAAEVLAFGQRP
jgi:hypothetical protein